MTSKLNIHLTMDHYLLISLATISW